MRLLYFPFFKSGGIDSCRFYHRNTLKQYIIPYNFAKEGYVYGKITWSSMVQAIILVGAAGNVIFRLLPFTFKVRMYLAIFILENAV